MSKWADYCISHVRYTTDGDYIESVMAYEDTGNSLRNPESYERSTMVKAIENGWTVSTIFMNDQGRWKRGSEVIIVEINRRKFLKTTPNEIEMDNLEGLPEY